MKKLAEESELQAEIKNAINVAKFYLNQMEGKSKPFYELLDKLCEKHMVEVRTEVHLLSLLNGDPVNVSIEFVQDNHQGFEPILYEPNLLHINASHTIEPYEGCHIAQEPERVATLYYDHEKEEVTVEQTETDEPC